MKNGNMRIWALRAGKQGRAHHIFINDSLIVLEDAAMGNLAVLDETRKSFCSKYRGIHPEDTQTGSAGIAGKFFRFAAEMTIGDWVVYPALPDKQIYVGKIVGEYEYVEDAEFPHQRAVNWKYVIPKSEFSTQARYELGAARTLFEIKRNRNELLQKIKKDDVTRFKAKKKTKA